MYSNEDNSQMMDDPYSTPLQPQTILLRDGETVSTMYPIPANPDLLPIGLVEFLLDEFNMEIENGQSFPYYEPLSLDEFKKSWFDCHGVLCVMVLGELPELDYSVPINRSEEIDEVLGLKYSERFTSTYMKRKERRNLNLSIQWERQCLGIFDLKPAYPGRSSHVATGTFLVNAGIRGKGIGKTLVDCFLNWAPQLGFTSCYFPLVYGTNVGIRRIFESSNFRRIGKLPESGILKGFDSPVDSFIYGKEFTHVSKHMNSLHSSVDDTIKAKYERLIYYLEHGEYPPSCNRNEKARLRVIAKKHSLINGKLHFKGKEVVYDPQRQLRIAYETHIVDHQGINRVTSKLAEKYHWKGIKQTVIQVINSCSNCQENTNRMSDESVVIDTRTDPNGQPHTIVHAVPQGHISESLETLEELTPADSTNKSRLKTSFVQRIKFGKDPGSESVKRKLVTSSDDSMNSFSNYANEGIKSSIRKKSRSGDPRGSEPGTVILEEETPNSMVDDALLNLEDNVMAAVEAVRNEQQQKSSPSSSHINGNSKDSPHGGPTSHGAHISSEGINRQAYY
ncbi:Spt10 [Kluyveromyces lactis]|nr:Spt10 [Kluyveromyces lactis]